LFHVAGVRLFPGQPRGNRMFPVAGSLGFSLETLTVRNPSLGLFIYLFQLYLQRVIRLAEANLPRSPLKRNIIIKYRLQRNKTI